MTTTSRNAGGGKRATRSRSRCDRVHHLVEVVEHEDDGLLARREGIDQRGQHQVRRHRLARTHGERRDGVVAGRLGQRP